MKRTGLKRTVLIDAAIAVALVGCVLTLAPGLAIVGIVTLVLLVVGGTSFLIELGTARRRPELRPRGRPVTSSTRTAGRARD